jgi:hypothetical protein
MIPWSFEIDAMTEDLDIISLVLGTMADSGLGGH